MPKTVEIELDRVIRQALEVAVTPPQQRTEVPLPRWTLKRLVVWIQEQFKGVYLYNLGQVRLFPSDVANGLNTIEVLSRIRAEFPDLKMTAIWDGAPYHRSQVVKDEAALLKIALQPLPAYSPDFMPVEHLWQWFREDLTYHICYQHKADLIEQVQLFQHRLNQTPVDVADRLWVKSHLEPTEEKLRVSS